MAKKRPIKRAKKPVKGRQQRSIFAYPAVIFLLLCIGVFLVGWTLKSGAADVIVSAKVSAPFVTDSAVITNPVEGIHVSAVPINVSGTCPDKAAYVEIFDGSQMAGAAICQSDNTFSLDVNLLPDANILTAHVFNSTDDEGPVSDQLTIYYDVPQPPTTQPTPTGTTSTPNSSSGTPNSVANLPLSLKTEFVYKGFHVGDKVQWPVEISGGTVPFAISVDWGDGTSDIISRPQAGQVILNHVYSQQGGYNNSYTVKVKASDAGGNNAFIQFFLIITPLKTYQSGTIFSKPTPGLGNSLKWLYVAWPAYIAVMLMAFSYWLGEREELILLRKRGMLRR